MNFKKYYYYYWRKTNLKKKIKKYKNLDKQVKYYYLYYKYYYWVWCWNQTQSSWVRHCGQTPTVLVLYFFNIFYENKKLARGVALAT
jgi:hypothetical protein